MIYDFKKWSLIREGRDIFGFEKKRVWTPEGEENDKPIVPVNVAMVIEYLSQMNLPTKMPHINWVNELVWGEESGAVQLNFSPLGSFKAMIRKKITDLSGNETWICKDCYNLTYTKSETDASLSQNLFERVNKIDQLEPDSPSRDYKDLENLTLAIATRFKRDAPEIFMFEGVKKLNDNNYLVYASLAGSGQEAPGAGKVEEFVIDISYSRDRGLIRIFGHDVQSPIKVSAWSPQPSEWDEWYCPTQSRDEIEKTTIDILSTY